MVTQTYYVGDLLSVNLGAPTGPINGVETGPGATVRPKVDVEPVRDLITSTVAPGIWETRLPGDQVPTTGACIVPFYLSVSLIVRCPPEVHDQVANLLRRLRVILDARDAQTAQRQQTDKTDATPKIPAAPASRQRVQQLLDELQKEVAKLPL